MEESELSYSDEARNSFFSFRFRVIDCGVGLAMFSLRLNLKL